MKTKIIVGAMVCFAVCLFMSSQVSSEPRREAILSKPVSGLYDLEEETPAWKTRIIKKMDKKVTFDYLETPLIQVVKDLSKEIGETIVLDPGARVDDMGAPLPIAVTLRVDNMRFASALNWILRLTDLYMTLRDEAIFIGAEAYGESVLRIYDVRDLTVDPVDYPAPDIGISGAINSDPDLKKAPATDDDVEYDVETASDLIRSTIAPEHWDSEDGRSSLDVQGGRLVVTAPARVQELILQLITNFRRTASPQIRVSAKVYSVSESLFDEMASHQKEGEKQIYLKAAQLKLLAEAAEKGKDSQFLDGMHVTACNTQRVHVLSGHTEVDKKENAWFRGYILDVRPILGEQKKYVSTTIVFKRILGTQGVCVFKTHFKCLISDTVMLVGSPIPGNDNPRRLIVLVTPELLEH